MPTKCFCRGIRLSDAVEAEEISHCALHAAAPELVEALKEVLYYFDHPKGNCGVCEAIISTGHEPGCVIPTVQAALAKADGKS